MEPGVLTARVILQRAAETPIAILGCLECCLPLSLLGKQICRAGQDICSPGRYTCALLWYLPLYPPNASRAPAERTAVSERPSEAMGERVSA